MSNRMQNLFSKKLDGSLNKSIFEIKDGVQTLGKEIDSVTKKSKVGWEDLGSSLSYYKNKLKATQTVLGSFRSTVNLNKQTGNNRSPIIIKKEKESQVLLHDRAVKNPFLKKKMRSITNKVKRFGLDEIKGLLYNIWPEIQAIDKFKTELKYSHSDFKSKESRKNIISDLRKISNRLAIPISEMISSLRVIFATERNQTDAMDILKASSVFAKAHGENPTETSEWFSKLMHKNQDQDSSKVADLLTFTAHSAVGFKDMKEFITTILGEVGSTGVSLKDQIALLITLKENGIKERGSGIARNLGTVFTKMTSDELAMAKLKDLDVEVKGNVMQTFASLFKKMEGTNDSEKNRILGDIFGNHSASMVQQLEKNWSKIPQLNQTIDEQSSGLTANKLVDMMASTSEQVNSLYVNLLNLGSSLSSIVIPSLKIVSVIFEGFERGILSILNTFPLLKSMLIWVLGCIITLKKASSALKIITTQAMRTLAISMVRSILGRTVMAFLGSVAGPIGLMLALLGGVVYHVSNSKEAQKSLEKTRLNRLKHQQRQEGRSKVSGKGLDYRYIMSKKNKQNNNNDNKENEDVQTKNKIITQSKPNTTDTGIKDNSVYSSQNSNFTYDNHKEQITQKSENCINLYISPGEGFERFSSEALDSQEFRDAVFRVIGNIAKEKISVQG